MSEENKSVKSRYSDEELSEFKTIILNKLERARKDYQLLKSTLSHEDSNDIEDTSPTFNTQEDWHNDN